jgi:signal recognition particle GTPase
VRAGLRRAAVARPRLREPDATPGQRSSISATAGCADRRAGEEEARVGVFRRLRESLSKSRQALSEEISASLFDRIDEETWERLEEALIMADAGRPRRTAAGGRAASSTRSRRHRARRRRRRPRTA